MTHFRIEVKTLSKAEGQSAAAAHRYDDRVRHSDKSDLWAEGSVNMPTWASPDVSKFWSAADEFERANGLVARRAILSFPNQLPPEDRESYVRDWLSLNVPNCPASWAIHDEAGADPRNPHVHILISERINDGIPRPPELFFKRYNSKSTELGGCRKMDIGSNRKDWLSAARSSWAGILNKHLPADQQVSHLSNSYLGLSEPQPKFGAKVLGAERKGIRTRLVSSVVEDAATKSVIRCLSFIDPVTNRTVTYRSGIDRGDSVEIVGKLRKSKVIDLVLACKEKGWTEVDLWGSDEFKQMARAELLRAGIKIKGEKNEQNQSNDSKSNQRGSDRVGEDSGANRTGRPARTGPSNEQDRRPGAGRDSAQQQADRNAQDVDGAARHDNRETPLDNLGDHRRDDIRDIAATYDSVAKPANTGLPAGKRGNDMQADLTYRAVQKQLSALSEVREFEIGILNQKTGRMMLSKASPGQILDQVARLKRENARGNNIYIRPDRETAHPYVLMDDLSHEQVAQLESAGFAAALTLETSPNNHQVLIKMPQPLKVENRKQIERALQKRFCSDPGSADGQHLFRLGGFTNRKPKHERGGKFPYVLVTRANQSPVMSARAAEWLQIAPKIIDVPNDQPEKVVEKVATSRPEWQGKRGELGESVERSHLYLQVKYGPAYDPSIADFQIAKTLLRQGWNSDSVREGLRDGSPDLLTRKVGHVDDYLDRTLSKVTGKVAARMIEDTVTPVNKQTQNPKPRP
jgi:hypothetical protein